MANVHSPEIEFGDAPQRLCAEIGVPGCLVVVLLPDGCIGFHGHGVNHAKAAEMLSRAMQMNLNDHDQRVLDGAAGEQAQSLAVALSRHHGAH